MDLSEPARASCDQPGDRGPGAAASAGESGAGIPQSARGTHQARLPCQRGNRAADPARQGSRRHGRTLAGRAGSGFLLFPAPFPGAM